MLRAHSDACRQRASAAHWPEGLANAACQRPAACRALGQKVRQRVRPSAARSGKPSYPWNSLIAAEPRDHYFQAALGHRFAGIPGVDTVYARLVHCLKNTRQVGMELLARDAPYVMTDAVMRRNLRRDRGLVIRPACELVVCDGDALEFACTGLDHQSGQRPGVDSARQEHAHRHVRHQVPRDRSPQRSSHALAHLVRSGGRSGRRPPCLADVLPAARGRHAALLDPGACPRGRAFARLGTRYAARARCPASRTRPDRADPVHARPARSPAMP